MIRKAIVFYEKFKDGMSNFVRCVLYLSLFFMKIFFSLSVINETSKNMILLEKKTYRE